MAHAMGIDPRTGEWNAGAQEVKSIAVVDVAADMFDLPPGLKRRPSPEEDLLRLSREAKHHGTAMPQKNR